MKLTVSKDLAALRTAATRPGLCRRRPDPVALRHQPAGPGHDLSREGVRGPALSRRLADLWQRSGPDQRRPGERLSVHRLSELGITAETGWEIAQFYVQGAALFRQAGAVIDGIRLGCGQAVRDRRQPRRDRGIEAAAYAAFASLPIPSV